MSAIELIVTLALLWTVPAAATMTLAVALRAVERFRSDRGAETPEGTVATFQ